MKERYSEEEALQIIKHLTEAFAALKKMEIYHGDIKLSNIIFSKSKNSYYLIIDFGISKFDEEGDRKYPIKISDFVVGGTEGYDSPEKQKYLLLKEDSENFNPFRCDAWSLGICFSKLLGKKKIKEWKKPIWKEIKRMNEKEINYRIDACDLNKILHDESINEIESLIEEERHLIKKLEEKRIKEEGYKHLYDKYEKASMYPELELIALEENKGMENDGDSVKYILARLDRLGKIKIINRKLKNN